MYFGLTLSLAAHLLLLGWALVSFQATPAFKLKEPEAVEVAIISEDDVVRLTKGRRDAKRLKTRKAEPVEQPVRKKAKKPVIKTVPAAAAAAEPPAEDEISKKLAALPPDKPAKPKGPTPAKIAAQKKLEELALKKAAEKIAAEKKAAEAKKKAEAEQRKKAAAKKKRQAELAKKRAKERAKKRARERARRLAEKRRRDRERQAKNFDSGRIAALLNKIPDARAPDAGSFNSLDDPNLARGPAAGAPEGQDTRLTASQRSLLAVMMKRAVSRCWNINSGLDGIDREIVDIEVRLGRDGRIRGTPRVANSGHGPLFQDAANSAVRALIQCEPYDLPKQFYEGGWDHMVVTFDPQKMF